jgi:hypothetical protein
MSLYKSILKIELIKEMALYYDNNIPTHMETHNNFSLNFPTLNFSGFFLDFTRILPHNIQDLLDNIQD